MLNGINKKCEQCTENCKQFLQVAIITCPNFKTTQHKKLEPSMCSKSSKQLVKT